MIDSYLIDTQILIWLFFDPTKVKPKILKLIEKHKIYVSQTSIYELAIKNSIGKLSEFNIHLEELVSSVKEDGFEILTIDNQHIFPYKSVPFIDNHRDPFDRLLIATALSEGFTLISADRKFKKYKHIIQLLEN